MQYGDLRAGNHRTGRIGDLTNDSARNVLAVKAYDRQKTNGYEAGETMVTGSGGLNRVFHLGCAIL